MNTFTFRTVLITITFFVVLAVMINAVIGESKTKNMDVLSANSFVLNQSMSTKKIAFSKATKEKLRSANYHTLRNNLNNSFQKFSKKKKGRIAFLGGSITANGGWRDSICSYLKMRFPKTEFEFVAAGIGSMGTTSASFRFERDVLSRGPIDLLFEEAAVNDNGLGRSLKEQIRGMEGIVRHARKANPTTDIIIMHFADPDKMKTYRNGQIPEVIQNHEKVALHYDISTINLAKEVTDRIDHNEFTWENDFKNLHPSPFGQGVYAHSIITFLENMWKATSPEEDNITDFQLKDALDVYNYNCGALIPAATINPVNGWALDNQWEPNDGAKTRKNYTNVPMLIGEFPTEDLAFTFEGNTVGIVVAAGPDAGIIEYCIDGAQWKRKDLFVKASYKIHLPKYYTLGSGLKPERHTLQIRLIKEKNVQSIGNMCRIRYFFFNKK